MSVRLAILASIASVGFAANVHDRAFYEEKFFNWMSEHKVVANNGDHFVSMIQNFANNDDLIASTNAKNLTYKLGHNQFSHLSVEEYRQYVGLGLNKPTLVADRTHNAPKDISNLAASVDWVAKGAVTPVKDQGQCGSCWAFSTTGALEGAYFNTNGKLVSFSEQNLVDCDTPKNGGSDLACHGGLMDSAFTWIKKNGGLATEGDYSYFSGDTKKNGECQTDKALVAGSAVKSYTDVEVNSDAAMLSALNVGPVAVAIQADQAAFQLYKSGVFTAECGTALDHGVLAVGYGTQDGLDYYTIKNSWGASWGEGGYIKFVRGGNTQPEGQCGVLSGPPSYPSV
eukprot:gene33982-41912_t